MRAHGGRGIAGVAVLMQAEPGCARLGSGAAWSYPVTRWVGKRVVRNSFCCCSRSAESRRRASGGKWRSPQKASARPMASAAFGTNARARGAPAAHGRSCEAAPCLFLSDPSASTSTPSTSTPREFCLASLLMIREMMLTSLMVLGFLRTDEVSAHSLRNRSTPCLHI